MRLLVCGSRNWSDRDLLYATLDMVHATSKDLLIIQGACSGADLMSQEWALERDVECLSFPANWALGNSAGPIRNRQMLIEGLPDALIAFTNDFRSSKGTRNMVEMAQKKGLPCHIVGE